MSAIGLDEYLDSAWERHEIEREAAERNRERFDDGAEEGEREETEADPDGHLPEGDYYLVRGDLRHDLPPKSQWDLICHETRITEVKP